MTSKTILCGLSAEVFNIFFFKFSGNVVKQDVKTKQSIAYRKEKNPAKAQVQDTYHMQSGTQDILCRKSAEVVRVCID